MTGYVRVSTASSEFERTRRYYIYILSASSQFAKKYTIGDKLDDDSCIISPYSILQDLYISWNEDRNYRKDYWKQVEEFKAWYNSLGNPREVLDSILLLEKNHKVGKKVFSPLITEKEAKANWDRLLESVEAVEVLYKTPRQRTPAPRDKWLLPDGTIKYMTFAMASRHYFNKGINIKRIDE